MLPAHVDFDALRAKVDDVAARSPYGWGHAIDFGPYRKEGLLADNYLKIASLLDEWDWWGNLRGGSAADVGCFTGGLTLYMAAHGAASIYAIDEIPTHLEQCRLVVDAFEVRQVECLQTSLYHLERYIPPASLDVILLSGVLYHLSDMLVGLVILRKLLKDDGALIIESFAVDDFEHSYANFGRFVAGAWWQPTALCIQDMCEFTGFEKADVRFYWTDRCLARTRKLPGEPAFKRGMNYSFPDIHDARPRGMDLKAMAPAPMTKIG